jgi:hypothetical protein
MALLIAAINAVVSYMRGISSLPEDVIFSKKTVADGER